jgi:tRNA(Ile)-lysidine synthase
VPQPPTTRFIRTVADTILAHPLLSKGENVLVGVSGGPDSMALLHALCALAPRYAWRLGVAHLNHGLRPEAEADERFVAKAAADLGLSCFHRKEDVTAYQKSHGLCLEEAARDVRYRYLSQVALAEGFSAVALGHHGDDNGELVLMNLLRGSGPLGLSGMPPVRSIFLQGTSIRLIRPMLGLYRREIEEYLVENGVSFVTDQSNGEIRFLRNRIRHELIPLLSSYTPRVPETLNRLAEIMRSEEEWAETLTEPLFRAAVLSEGNGRIVLSIASLREAPPGARRRIIRRALAEVRGSLRRIGFVHVDAVMDLALKRTPGRLDLPDRIRVLKEGDQLTFTREQSPLRGSKEEQTVSSFEYLLTAPGSLCHRSTRDDRLGRSVSGR